jgi:hypothetical protein
MSFDWQVCMIMHEVSHPVHGRFFVTESPLSDRVSAQRVWGSHPELKSEHIGDPHSYKTLEDGKAACVRRIAELDAAFEAEVSL